MGHFDFALELRPAGSPVDVCFAYDLDGVVRVTVSQPGTKNEKTVQLRLSDASELGVDAPVLRKARALLANLDGDERVELERLIDAYQHAQPLKSARRLVKKRAQKKRAPKEKAAREPKKAAAKAKPRPKPKPAGEQRKLFGEEDLPC